MPSNFEALAIDALALPEEQRAQLADVLLQSLTKPGSSNANAKWASEIRRRAEEVLAGTAKTVSLQEALQQALMERT